MKRNLLLILLALGCAFPLDGLAQDSMANAPMVREKIQYRAQRHEVKIGLGSTINDRYFYNFVLNLGYDYHFLDWLAAGVNIGYAFPIKAARTKEIEEEKKVVTESSTREFPMPATHLGMLADAHVLVSFGGKLMAMNKAAVPFDFHIMVGIGVLQTKWNEAAEANFKDEPKDDWLMSPRIGIGFRLFLAKGVSIAADIVDHMAYQYTVAGVDHATYDYCITGKQCEPKAEREWKNNVAAMLNVNVMFPLKPRTGK
jgi:outer membrane beta-barrel protein